MFLGSAAALFFLQVQQGRFSSQSSPIVLPLLCPVRLPVFRNSSGPPRRKGVLSLSYHLLSLCPELFASLLLDNSQKNRNTFLLAGKSIDA